jgi:hypothetical protein
MNANAGIRSDVRIVHGVLLPVAAFSFISLLFYVLKFASLGPDGLFIMILAFFFFPGVCIPVITVVNLLLMIPKWKKRGTVRLIGSILPVCILAVEIYALATMDSIM